MKKTTFLISLMISAASCYAQTRPTIANPLIKPQKAAQTVSPPAAGAPQVRPVEAGSDPKAPGILAPIPNSVGTADSTAAAAQSDLAHYYVSAIYRDKAILRVAAPTQGQSGSSGSGGSVKRATMKVTSGVPISIGQNVVIPSVLSNSVSFALRGSGVIVHTAMLESEIGISHAIPTSQRESFDATVSTRIAPPVVNSISQPNAAPAATSR